MALYGRELPPLDGIAVQEESSLRTTHVVQAGLHRFGRWETSGSPQSPSVDRWRPRPNIQVRCKR